MSIYAQGEAEDVLRRIFRTIGVANRFAVEFGARDGVQWSNTADLRLNHGWTCLLMDIEPRAPFVRQERITAENINFVFGCHGVPQRFDLLSIDVDGIDFWLWKALTYRPRVVVIEYNQTFGPDESFTVPYDPDFAWDHTPFYGASPRALTTLAHEKGYVLAEWLPVNSPNMFFVDEQEAWMIHEPDLPHAVPSQYNPDSKKRSWFEY